MNGKPARNPRGFTLIELMIVVVIAALLAAVALPNYSAYVMRSHRAHAKAALLKAAQWMERTATAQGAYPANASVLTAAGLDVVEGGRYKLALSNATATTYKLTAVRADPGGNATDKCGDFTLNHTGVRGLEHNSLNVTDCWSR